MQPNNTPPIPNTTNSQQHHGTRFENGLAGAETSAAGGHEWPRNSTKSIGSTSPLLSKLPHYQLIV